MDRGLRHRLPALIGNPLREEAAAFRLVFVTLGVFGLIALGSWISTWVGVGVVAALALGAAVLLWRWRREVRMARTSDRPMRRVLLVSGGRAIDPALVSALQGSADVVAVDSILDAEAALETFAADEIVALNASEADELRARFVLPVRVVSSGDYLPETPTR